MKCSLGAIVIAVFIFLHAADPLSAQEYTIIDIPVNSTYHHVSARGINNAGDVVGSADASPWYGYNRGFVYANGAIDFIFLGSANTNPVLAINDEGNYVGQASLPDFVNKGFLNSSYLPPPFTDENFWISDINNANQICGYTWDGTTSRIVIFEGTQVIDIPNISFDDGVDVNAINDSGFVTGTRWETNEGYPFIYSHRDSQIVYLPNLAVGGSYPYTEAYDINNSNDVVGYYNQNNNPWGGFVYRNGSYTQFPYGLAQAINDSGVVVGELDSNPTMSGGEYAFIYDPVRGVRDLNTLIPTGSGWELLSAEDINDVGQIIGIGRLNGNVKSFILTPRKLKITKPAAGDLVVAGEADTIRWTGGDSTMGALWLSTNFNDGFGTFTLIADSIPIENREYVWNVPDSILSRKCRIVLQDMTDPAIVDTTPAFRIKGFVLTNVSVTNDYIAYDPTIHQWGFENTSADVWPAAWYGRFNYRGTDPFTGYSYSQTQGGGVFSTANPSDHPDWESFVRTFGVSACYKSTLFARYSPTALARWQSVKGTWGGSCFGIAISNAVAFRNYAALQLAYPELPLFTVPIYLTSDSTTIPMANTLFTHQLGDPHVTYRANVGILKTPNQTLHDLKTMCLSETASVRTLSLLNNGPGGGGHAILAYKVKKDPVQPTVYNVYVYDNSWADSTTAHIDIDTTLNGGNGGWSYALWPGWGGSKWLYLRDPALTYLSTPTIPKNNPDDMLSPFLGPDGWLELGTPNGMSISITDSSGNVTGYVDSLMRSDIPGSFPLVVENGSKTPPCGYLFPTGSYSVALTDFATPDVDAFFFVSNVSFRYGRKGAQAQQTDYLRFDGSVTFINHDPEEKEILLETIVNEAPVEKVARFSAMRVAADDSLNLLPLANDQLKLTVFGQMGKIRVMLEFVADTVIAEFVRDSIPLSPNTSYIFVPDWPGLGSGGVLTVLVDQGNDGTTDDTLFYSNQATGVDGEIGSTRPERFVLAQNYPNPFNSSTVIEYGLPTSTYVTLKVYDVLGREVQMLVDEFQQAGYKQARWDASGMPSGVYYVRMTAGAFTDAKKILLMK